LTPVRGRGAAPNAEPPPNGDHEYAHHDYSTWDAAYALGSLSANDRREFEAHLGGCAPCREAVTELSGMPAVLGLLDRDEVAAMDNGDQVSGVPPLRPELLTPWLLHRFGPRRRGVSGPLEPQTILPFSAPANYAPVPDELTAFDLPMRGSIQPN
jgi:Putative zinc-finger